MAREGEVLGGARVWGGGDFGRTGVDAAGEGGARATCCANVRGGLGRAVAALAGGEVVAWGPHGAPTALVVATASVEFIKLLPIPLTGSLCCSGC
jgi:hypothetical protein